ncbi:MAG TPA: hypothetical protein VFK89_04575 [Actinomycetota bacterium]|nr:hypothetical protein [Actinomycetota bacterium]
MRRILQGITAVALVLSALLMMSSPALATPKEVGIDRSDNEVTFGYDAPSGAIGSQTTSTRAGINQDVTFTVTVDEAEGTGPGLIARVILRLDTDRGQIYDGWFSLHVADADGETAFHRARPRFVRLRPEPGCRRVALRYVFDLPTGDYEMTGTFQAS